MVNKSMDFWTLTTDKNVTGPQNTCSGHLKIQKVQKVNCFEHARNAAMLAIVFYLFSKICYMRLFTDV